MKNGSILVRAALIYGAVLNGGLGLWATVDPRGFYDSFPGFGRVWVAVDGPYNEHLVRDVGALALGVAIVLVAAAWTMSRPLVLTGGIAMTAAALPHTLYHLRHADVYDGTADKVASLGGLVLGTLLGIVVLVAGLRWRDDYAPKRA
ncbi:MAG: hypothetical protein QOH64_2960 [Acidimicrobiaceae bacterium]